MREVVLSPACERFFKGMAQALRQVFSRRADRELVVFTSREFHDASQWIVCFSPRRFVPQQLFDLFLVCDVERSIQINKPTRRTIPHLQARRANHRSRVSWFGM